MDITKQFREKVREAILQDRQNYGGSNAAYAKTIGINPSAFSRLNKGETERIIDDSKWISIGKNLGVQFNKRKWNIARTEVYDRIEKDINFCKDNSKSMILVDDCGIGKTICAKHVIRGLKNAFYIDCSQAKTKQVLIRTIAKAVGVNNRGRYQEVKEELKYCLNILETPVIVLDETGDLKYDAFLEIKELWNGSEGSCAWYMMGADGLQAKLKKGIDNKRVGYAEIFSRFSDEYTKVSPIAALKTERVSFYKQLITDIATANMDNKKNLNQIINKCLSDKKSMRYLDTLISYNR